MQKEMILMPSTEKILAEMGEQIRMARLRRNIPMKLVCERARISRNTLWQIEKGKPTVAIGYYAAVLHALNRMDGDLLLVAKDDALGKKLVELGVSTKKRIR